MPFGAATDSAFIEVKPSIKGWDKTVASVVNSPATERAGAQAGLDIGVGLPDDQRPGVPGPRAPEQGEVGAFGPGAQADRGVVLDLAGHQDAVARGQAGHGAGQVVFRHPAGHQRPGQRGCPRRAARWQS